MVRVTSTGERPSATRSILATSSGSWRNRLAWGLRIKAVDGGMPEHGHGLPTEPYVTGNLGGGDYLVEGLRFQMKGWWEVKFTISTSENTDEVVFNLIL